MGSSEYNHRAQTAARGVEPGMIKKKRKIKGRGLIWKLTSRERENTTRALQGMFKREKIKEGQETRAVENEIWRVWCRPGCHRSGRSPLPPARELPPRPTTYH
jgi:hypothetical protein